MSDEKLKECPFCGSDKISVAHRDSQIFPFTVGCGGPNCGAEIILRSKDDAVAAWNRRAPSPVERAREDVVEVCYEHDLDNCQPCADYKARCQAVMKSSDGCAGKDKE